MQYKLPTNVTANPVALDFPTDVNGITATLRKAGLAAAQKVYSKDQYELVVFTLKLLILHTKAVYERNAADVQAVLAENAKQAQAEASLVAEAIQNEFTAALQA